MAIRKCPFRGEQKNPESFMDTLKHCDYEHCALFIPNKEKDDDNIGIFTSGECAIRLIALTLTKGERK